MLRLKFYPDKDLRTPAIEVPEINGAVQRKASDMIINMRRWNGQGLAAPQIGWSARLFVANLTGQKADDMVFVNPRIVWRSKQTSLVREACLSIPRFVGQVSRHREVDIEGFNGYGETIAARLTGPLAIVVQHEVDHLDGVLFVDKLTPVDKVRWVKWMKRCRAMANQKKARGGLMRRLLRDE